MKFQVLILLFICLGCQSSQKKGLVVGENPQKEMAALADLYFTKLTALDDFNGVVLLKKKNKVILKKAYNLTSDSTSTLFVTKNSQFDLRSIAKLFAKLSLVELEAEGILSKQDTLHKFLPNFPNANKITVEHLMTNTSGLPRSFEETNKPFIELKPDEVLELAAKATLEFKPGSNELYSNVGFQLLYYMIGEAANSSFEAYINQRFFEPLAMTHTGSNFFTGKERKTHYAYGHFKNDNDEVICECTFPEDEMQMGNLFSTTTDLDSLLSHLDKNRYKDLIQGGSISHAGGTRGKRAYVERNYEDAYSIIFLANYDQIPFEKVVADVQHILKGDPVEMPKAVSRKAVYVPVAILKQYQGTYDLVDAGHLMLTVTLENDSLYMYQKGKNNGVLYPESQTVFFGDKASEESVEFIKNDQGTYDMLLDFQGVQWKGIRLEKE